MEKGAYWNRTKSKTMAQNAAERWEWWESPSTKIEPVSFCTSADSRMCGVTIVICIDYIDGLDFHIFSPEIFHIYWSLNIEQGCAVWNILCEFRRKMQRNLDEKRKLYYDEEKRSYVYLLNQSPMRISYNIYHGWWHTLIDGFKITLLSFCPFDFPVLLTFGIWS